MNLFRWSAVAALMSLALVFPRSGAGAEKAEGGGQAKSNKSRDSAKVTVEVRDWAGVQKLVDSHQGKVVLVDIWTSTCLSCIEEFPKFADLEEELGPENVALISVNCDYDGIEGKPPSFYRDDVLKFLRKHDATFENVMLNVAFIDFLDQVDLATTPAVYVYAPDGRLAKRFDNDDLENLEDAFTIEDVKQFAKTLLPKKRQ